MQEIIATEAERPIRPDAAGPGRSDRMISDLELIEPVTLVVGVTGHRDLVETEIPGLSDQILKFFEKIQELCPHTPVGILTPLAEGGDLLVAKVISSSMAANGG